MEPTTPERLRAAAEALLIERGHRATTLRDITARAGANIAAVGYHFGSKDALLGEVFLGALREATEVQRQRLDALAPDAPLEDVVHAWLAPVLHAPGTDPRQEQLWRLITRGMSDGAPQLMAGLPQVHGVVDTALIDRLARALPHLSREELLVRHALVLRSVAALDAGETAPLGGALTTPGFAEMLVAWIVGGLSAPAATPV